MYRSLFLVAALQISGVAFAEEELTKRDLVVEEYDTNSDGILKGKELKLLSKEREKLHISLMNFCDKAGEDPSAHGVSLPEGAKGKDKKCKKSYVSAAFLDTWTALGKPAHPPEPEPVVEPEKPKVILDAAPQ